MKKFLIMLSMAFMLCIPALADYVEPVSGTFVGQEVPLVTGSNDEKYSSMFTVLYSSTSERYYKLGKLYDYPCYVFTVPEMNQVYAVCLDSEDSDPDLYYGTSVYSGRINHSRYGNVDKGGTKIAYYKYQNNINLVTDSYIPVFTNYEDGLAYVAAIFRGDIDISPLPAGQSASFTLPAGNVAFVDFGASGVDYGVTATTQFTELSNIFTGQFSPVTQRWYWTDSLPQNSGQLNTSSGTVIPWYKTSPFNLVGQSHYGYVSSATMVANGFWSSTASSRYLVIVNPYYNSTNINADYPNYNMTVSVSNAQSVKVYSLQETFNSTGIVENVDSNSYYDGTFDGEGGTGWVNQDGEVSEPQFGGDNYVPPAQTAESLASEIKSILNGLVEKVTTIFTVTHSAIQNLVSASSEFFAQFRSLYAWVPSSVLSVLESGMVVAVTIGVLKVFL